MSSPASYANAPTDARHHWLALRPSYTAAVVWFVATITIAKLVVAALTPLAFDEALYWRYSKHLAAGFIDHPFMNPLMIRLGTMLFGDTPLGVRFMAIALSLPASWAIWRAAHNLFENDKIAATAVLFLNLTVVMSVGSMVATSDEVVVTTSCFILCFLSELQRSERGAWWLAVGVAFGLGMCSKYTTIFFGVSILAWLILVPTERRWLLSPWAWAGGALAVLIFSPVLLWNSQHRWISFVYQSGRMTVYKWTGRYIAELAGALVVLATPPIFILGCIGLAAPIGRRVAWRTILACSIAPMMLYFLWHATHARVQGNWPEPVFPAFVLAAAWGAASFQGRTGFLAGVARWSSRLATPFGIGLALIIYVEVVTGIVPLGSHDPRTKVLGVGWTRMGGEIDQLRARVGAGAVLTTEYPLASWGMFYLSRTTPVIEADERIRWVNEPTPGSSLFNRPVLYLCRGGCGGLSTMRAKFLHVTRLATFQEAPDHRTGSNYSVFEASMPVAPVLDSSTLVYRADHEE